MKRPLLPREYLEQFMARRAQAKDRGVTLTGDRQIDETRMAHASGLKRRSLGELLEMYGQQDWQGMVEKLSRDGRER